MTTVLTHRVRYHEADAQGFMFNSRFLEIADVAMTEFFRDLGFPYLELVAGGTDPSVVEARVHYKAPARFEDVLDVAAWCTRVGNSSFSLAVRITCGETDVADIQLAYVNIDAREARSRALPSPVADALRRSASTTQS